MTHTARSISGSCMALVLVLSACAPTVGGSGTDTPQTTEIATFPALPEDTEGSCWASLPGPKTTERVTETILVEEAVLDADGTEISPAIYRSTEIEKSVSTGPERWFEQVCDTDLTEGFVRDLQRALAARGYFDAEANGQLGPLTRSAVLAYQTELGLETETLSLAAGRRLGLIIVPLAGTEGTDEAAQ